MCSCDRVAVNHHNRNLAEAKKHVVTDRHHFVNALLLHLLEFDAQKTIDVGLIYPKISFRSVLAGAVILFLFDDGAIPPSLIYRLVFLGICWILCQHLNIKKGQRGGF